MAPSGLVQYRCSRIRLALPSHDNQGLGPDFVSAKWLDLYSDEINLDLLFLLYLHNLMLLERKMAQTALTDQNRYPDSRQDGKYQYFIIKCSHSQSYVNGEPMAVRKTKYGIPRAFVRAHAFHKEATPGASEVLTFRPHAF
jgi:hypothetical protein